MAGPGEQVVFERFDFETYLDPLTAGMDVYDPNIISPHLRTQAYDLQLTTGLLYFRKSGSITPMKIQKDTANGGTSFFAYVIG